MTKPTRKGTLKPSFEKQCGPRLAAAIRNVGGINAVAEATNVTLPIIYVWLWGKSRPRLESETFRRVEAYFAEKTGVILSHELGLDLLPELPAVSIQDLRGSYEMEDRLICALDVHRALRQMRKKHGRLADLLVKRYLEGETLREIGEGYELTYQGVEQREYKARAILARKLRQYAPAAIAGPAKRR